MKAPSILFVCLGNICRSPLAEAAMRDAAARAGVDVVVDSAGTGSWHIGHPPDERSIAVAEGHGIDISGYKGRQVRGEDFRNFDYIVALDPQNLRDLRKIAPSDTNARLTLLLDFVPGRAGEAVPDPYYQDDIAFEVVWRDVSAAAEALVELVRRD
ncbi:MAG: low molecular weight protein-tyrosine-phosphatase [Sphingomonas sp.]